jgi:hypothetical protein
VDPTVACYAELILEPQPDEVPIVEVIIVAPELAIATLFILSITELAIALSILPITSWPSPPFSFSPSRACHRHPFHSPHPSPPFSFSSLFILLIEVPIYIKVPVVTLTPPLVITVKDVECGQLGWLHRIWAIGMACSVLASTTATDDQRRLKKWIPSLKIQRMLDSGWENAAGEAECSRRPMKSD